MTRSKKILCVLLAVCMLIPFASCAKKGNEPTISTEPVTSETTTTEPAPVNINSLTGEDGLD